MTAFLRLRDRLRSMPSLQCGAGASEHAITDAQHELHVQFPSSYVQYLREFGWIEVDQLELFGIDPRVPDHLNLVSITLAERVLAEIAIGPSLVPVMADGAGNNYCLATDSSQAGECPVVFWDHEDHRGRKQIPEVVGETFADWLWAQLDWIESLPKE